MGVDGVGWEVGMWLETLDLHEHAPAFQHERFDTLNDVSGFVCRMSPMHCNRPSANLGILFECFVYLPSLRTCRVCVFQLVATAATNTSMRVLCIPYRCCTCDDHSS